MLLLVFMCLEIWCLSVWVFSGVRYPDDKNNIGSLISVNIAVKMSVLVTLVLVLFVNVGFERVSDFIDNNLVFFFSNDDNNVILQGGDYHLWRYSTSIQGLVSRHVNV